jgi:hypothetical protein
MKNGKTVALVVAALVAGLALGSVGLASAAQNAPQSAQGGLGLRLGAAMKDAGATLADVVASLTGSTADEVRAERAEGASFAEIASEAGVAADDVVASALEARKAVLDELVASGRITQAQADAALERMQTRLTERVSSDAPCAGYGKGAGRGRGGGRGPGACGACTAPAASE